MNSKKASTRRWLWSRYVSFLFVGMCFVLFLRIVYGGLPANILAHDYVLDALDGYLLIFFTATFVLHTMMAMEVIIEDYIHHKNTRCFMIWALRLLCLVMGGGACLKILSVTAFL